MQIHELNSFVGTPGAGDYLAIDDGSETTKVEASNLGVTTQMTQAEAEAGTETAPRVVAPSIFKSAVTAIASAISGVFVSMTNPKYTLDTSATSGDDYNLTQALTSLGWLSDVVTSGVLGGKKLMHKILGMLTVSSTYSITACGKPWVFHKVGRTVFFDAPNDIGSASAGINNLGTLPQAFRPQVQQRLGCGNKASWNAFVQISTDGGFILYTPSAITSTSNGAFSATYLSAS